MSAGASAPSARQQREELLKELRDQLEPCVADAEQMVREARAKANGGAIDESLEELLSEARAEVAHKVAQLNALEPNFDLQPDHNAKVVERAVEGGGAVHRVLPWTAPAPLQVEWADGTWYPCVLLDLVPPPTTGDRVAYRVWILGYNMEHVVCSEKLRPFKWQLDALPTAGAACHALHPSGWYLPGTVDRVTPHRTVWVTFTNDNIDDRVCELPLSLVRMGKHHAVLRKALSEEEKQMRIEERKKRKREHKDASRRQKVELFAQDCGTFMALKDELGV